MNILFSSRIAAAFTLFELLVVIVIVATLASLLGSSVASAKRRSAAAACSSNIRQIGLAMSFYADDNLDRLPPNRDGQNLSLGETWIEGWLGLPGPDCTNKAYLRSSLLGRYAPEVGLWRCPSTRPVKLGGISQLRVRTYSINGFMGSPVVSPSATTYLKRSEFVRPAPSELIAVAEERADTINDGAFSLQWDFDEKDPGQWQLRDQPATLHMRAGHFAFADGHVASKRWLDFLISNPDRDDQPAPGNRDLLWLQKHATHRPNGPNAMN